MIISGMEDSLPRNGGAKSAYIVYSNAVRMVTIYRIHWRPLSYRDILRHQTLGGPNYTISRGTSTQLYHKSGLNFNWKIYNGRSNHELIGYNVMLFSIYYMP